MGDCNQPAGCFVHTGNGEEAHAPMASDEEFQRLTLPALDLVHNLARRFVRDRADAEDLVQETYLRAWAAWSSGQRPRRVEPWLATICLNAGRDRARRASTRLETAATAIADLPDEVDVAEEAIGRMQRALVERALWALPTEQRVAIALMDLGGLTAAEVARVTGSPRGTVLARVHRGRKTLVQLVHQTEQEVGRDAP
jgi:RNA polymerase sigma-70 factor, ECF subfamily